RLVTGELRRRARASLRHERPDPALQTTVLIDDTFLKLLGDRSIAWEDRAQFYRLAARAMWQILVDHARKARAQNEGGGARPAPLHEVPEPAAPGALGALDLLVLDEALARLAQAAPALAEVVELHHFGGWELKQIARDILGISYKQAKSRWQMAQAW